MNYLHRVKQESQASLGPESDLKEDNPEGPNVLTKSVKVNMLRSLTDHLAVLTKTYTNRR